MSTTIPEAYPTYDDDYCMGKVAPSLETGKAVQGTIPKIGAGKPAVIVFFAKYDAGAGPVVAQVDKLFTKHGAAVDFAAVSLDPEESHVTSFLETANKFSFTAIFDAGKKINAAYKDAGGFTAIGIPHLFLVDKDGKIVWHEQFSQRKEMRHGQFAAQLDLFVEGKPLISNGKAPVEEGSDDGEEAGGDMDLGF